MNKAKKLITIVISLMAIGVFAGCQSPPEEEPKAVVEEAFSNIAMLDSYDFDIALSGEVEDNTDSVEIELGLEGSQDFSVESDPKLNIALNIAAMGEPQEGEQKTEKLAGELRLNKTHLYFQLSELSDFNGQLPTTMISPFIGKWWFIKVPEGTFPEATESQMEAEEATEPELTERDKQIRKLLTEMMIFGDLEYVKTKSGQIQYSGVLDKEELKELYTVAAEIQGVVLTEQNWEDFEKLTENLEITADIWVDDAKRVVSKIEGTITLEMDDELNINGGKATMTFNASFNNLDGPVSVDVPEDAALFDPSMLGLGAMQPEQPAPMDVMVDSEMDAIQSESEASVEPYTLQ